MQESVLVQFCSLAGLEGMWQGPEANFADCAISEDIIIVLTNAAC
jgi:hypothetical protein